MNGKTYFYKGNVNIKFRIMVISEGVTRVG